MCFSVSDLQTDGAKGQERLGWQSHFLEKDRVHPHHDGTQATLAKHSDSRSPSRRDKAGGRMIYRIGIAPHNGAKKSRSMLEDSHNYPLTETIFRKGIILQQRVFKILIVMLAVTIKTCERNQLVDAL